VKVVNTTWLAFGAEAVSASIAMAQRLDLDNRMVVDALKAGPLVSPWQSAKLDRILNDDFSPQFALRLALKDVRLAIEAAGAGSFAALNRLADEWQQAVEAGAGDQDLTVVTQTLARQGTAG
jgi:3-hydroxyisobutyrate dehydrogenase